MVLLARDLLQNLKQSDDVVSHFGCHLFEAEIVPNGKQYGEYHEIKREL